MTRDELKTRINREINVRDAAERVAGLVKDHKGRGPGYVCPGWHGDACGSGSGPNGTGLHYYQDSNTLYCFRCGHTFGPIDMLMHATGDYNAALERGAAELGVDWTTVTGRAPAAGTRKTPSGATEPLRERRNTEPTPNYRAYIRRAQDGLTDDSDGAAYLERRGLNLATARALGIGYDPAWRHPTVSDRVPTSPRIIVPMHTGAYDTRDIRTDQELEAAGALKYKKQSVSPKGLFNAISLNGTDPVHVVEGWADAVAVESAGGKAVSLNSTNGKDQLIELLDARDPNTVPPIILSLDPDDAGKTVQDELKTYLDQKGIKYTDGTIYLTGRDGTTYDPADSYAFDPPKFAACMERDRRSVMTDPAAIAFAGEDALHAQGMRIFADMISGKVQRISTGIEQLDKQLGGGLYSGLWVLGGRTGAGKTSFAGQIADNIAASGRVVLYVALEMSKEELYAKSLARLALDVVEERGETRAPSYSEIMEGCLRKKTWGARPLYERFRDAIEGRMVIFEAIGHTPANKVRELADTVRNVRGVSPVVFVDYLQIMGSDDERKTDKQAADSNVLGLKQLSRDLDTPVIVLSSLNRASYARCGDIPMNLASFKESGGIEYSADCLLALERTDTRGGDATERDVQVSMLKNRRGPCRKATGYIFRAGSCLFSPFEGAVREMFYAPEEKETTKPKRKDKHRLDW